MAVEPMHLRSYGAQGAMNGGREDAFRSMYLAGGPFLEKVARARGASDEDHIYTMQMRMENTNFEYVTAEDGPAKIELRKKLQELAESWVSSTPVSRKYYWYTIHMLVTRSLRSPQNADNPAGRVGNAFLALAKYARNIFSSPWRPEFRKIKLYGGYWHHEVGVVLDNPTWILSKLGYAASRECEHIWELSSDISVETLGEIHWASLDCFVAAVECQMISRIMAAVMSQDPSVTLEDIIQYREAHVGSWEYAVQGILYQARTQRFAAYPPPLQSHWQGYQHHQLPPPGPYGPQPPPPPPLDDNPYYNQQFPPYYPQQYQPLPQPQAFHHHPYQQPTPPPPPPPQVQQHYTQPIYEHFNPYHPVPISQFEKMNLKDPEPPKTEPKPHHQHHHRSDASSSRKHSRANSSDAPVITERPKSNLRLEKKKSVTSGNNQEDHTWDYVYSDLSSKGYSKDLGSRPDILVNTRKEPAASREEPTKHSPPPKESPARQHVPATPKEPQEWKCSACTFLNRPDTNICSVCYKSRDVVPERHENLGPECPQCTFKNFIGRDYCDACGALLRPSHPVGDI